MLQQSELCSPGAAVGTSASSSPLSSLLLRPMLLRGLELTSLLLRLSDTLSAAWAAVDDGAMLADWDCRPGRASGQGRSWGPYS